MKIVLLVSFLVQIIYSIETTVLEYLTRTDQQTLIVANQLFNVVESQRYFLKEPFTCLTILPSNLTKNHPQKVYKLNVTYNYKHLETITNEKQPTNIPSSHSTTQPTKQITGFYEDYDYDKILDLLHGTCAIHETNQFLYEYCHKQKVRQFDNMATLQRMAKTQYEDIAMGYFNYQEALKKSKTEQDKRLKFGDDMFKIKYSENGDLTILNTLLKNLPQITDDQKELLSKTFSNSNFKDANGAADQPQVTIQSIPTRSVIYDKKNLFTVSDINHKEYELNKEDRVIHLNYPIIKGNKYFTSVQYTHEVTCQYYVGNSRNIYVSKGVVISFFELAFLGNISKCDKVIEVSYRPIDESPYESPFYIDKFRQVDDFLYGYVDQFCTNNWDWRMTEHTDHIRDRDNFLWPGNSLWLEMITNVSGSLKYAYEAVTIKKVIAPGVVKIQQNIRQKLLAFKKQTATTPQDNAWINSCRIISKSPLVQTSLSSSNKILRESLIQINEKTNIKAKQSGDQLLCLCNFKKYNDDFLEMQITLGNKIFPANPENDFVSYFEFYSKKTVKTVNSDTQNLSKLCSVLLCYDMVNEKIQNNVKDDKKNMEQETGFTKIQKLTSSYPIQAQNLSSQNQIFIIDVSQKGMLKMHTQVESQKFIYLISTSMLIKIRLFENGTKQIVRQNSFYQNETTYNYVSWLGNSVFIHKNFIWRGYDKIVFPRMNLGHETITSIERISGYAYLRKWDLTKMKHKDSLYLSTIQEKIEDAFRVKKYPIFGKDEKIQAKTEEIKTSDEDAIEPQSVESTEQKVDFSKIDFSKSQFKPLNKSVSVRYQYFHGDYCGQPHNRYRRTNVDLQCGEPWLKIETVKEFSPCVYELKVSTRLLCREDYHKTVQKISNLNKNTDSRIKLEKGLVCYPEDAWDNALYVYDTQKRDVYVALK